MKLNTIGMLFLGAATAKTVDTSPKFERRVDGNFTTFKPPALKSFIHVDLRTNLPVNVTTTWGVSAAAPNFGGTSHVVAC
jgi:hypothetical protein